ncbi:uncharacterized protein BT62DRAFT_1012027 [Guyanagaster necrorhizus]|uniref:Uncharacterized protein n=1 Tax=Guyanagaster necrorhizus TaxID=856835 RepID=A0A9P7VII9_9AGAR|nr:uncharacterized protein BT62DRAFT_1012027 [Guyanagaster necrorhizus MCA 3950]KAG7441000.1 hypothetical protein BT62DRAFT_1012027 [Guyanagaster necrorhizus MCA 3950]
MRRNGYGVMPQSWIWAATRIFTVDRINGPRLRGLVGFDVGKNNPQGKSVLGRLEVTGVSIYMPRTRIFGVRQAIFEYSDSLTVGCGGSDHMSSEAARCGCRFNLFERKRKAKATCYHEFKVRPFFHSILMANGHCRIVPINFEMDEPNILLRYV